MRGYNGWGWRPYFPYDKQEPARPYICRLAPGETYVEAEWIQSGQPGGHGIIFYAKRQSDSWDFIEISSSKIRIDNLAAESEYKLYIRDENGADSRVRYFRTGPTPGVVINYVHPDDDQYAFSGRFCCSPSIVHCPSGALLASHDLYEKGRPQNLTLLFRSEDDGATWSYQTDLFPCFWGVMFYHRERLYMLAVTTEYGDLQIGASDDEGRTWSAPVSIFRGSGHSNENGFQKAPNPVTVYSGRLWVSIEYGSWGSKAFSSGALSISEDADLLVPENWACTELVPFNPAWPNSTEGKFAAIEGNILSAPGGGLINMMRYADNKAIIFDLSGNPEGPLKFRSIIEFPMGHSKFEIKRRAEDGLYYAVGNRLPLRNILSLYRSEDLNSWEFICDIANREDLPKEKAAFQYPAFIFDKSSLLVLSRTALNGAASFHNNNYLTFHRVSI